MVWIGPAHEVGKVAHPLDAHSISHVGVIFKMLMRNVTWQALALLRTCLKNS